MGIGASNQELLRAEKGAPVRIVYTNYKGITAVRTIVPKRIWRGETEWHPGVRWILDAYDVDKHADRSFAMDDIREIIPRPMTSSE